MSDKDNVMAEYTQPWWMVQLDKSDKELEKYWRKSARRIVDIYLADEDTGSAEDAQLANDTSKKYNIFWANTQIMMAALYATPPRPTVTRQHADAKDDVARTAALIMERILDFGITKDESDVHNGIQQAVEDRLIAGLGQVWLRYNAMTEEFPIPAVTDPVTGVELSPESVGLKVIHEDVLVDYVHWEDFLWSPARTWEEVWWVARRVWMRKSTFMKRFDKDGAIWKDIQGNVRESARSKSLPKGFKDGKVEIFEIWCKESNKVYWVCRNYEACLDEKDDPLGLDDFFPCPKPLRATHTSKTVTPRPDYAMTQDQYEELNILNTRISMLTKALRVVGVYDKNQAELQQLLTAGETRMIPVDNWAALGEKGGIAGVVDWFPVEIVANVLKVCVEQRQLIVQQIYELTSISDIMRGSSNPRDTLGAQKLKAQYSSVRLQLSQQAVSKFVRQVLRLKYEIISKHMQPETIAKISLVELTESVQYADQAIMLIKDYDASMYRIEISEESLSIADYNAERELRTEFLSTVGQFLSQAAMVTESMPGALPYLLRMVSWLASSFRGSSDIETVLDEAVKMATNAPPPSGPPAPPSPEEEADAKIKIENAKTKGKISIDNNAAKNEALVHGATKEPPEEKEPPQPKGE